MIRPLVRTTLLSLAVVAPALPQSRTAEIEAARDNKAAVIQPESVSRPEYLLLQVKERKLVERLTAGYNGLRAQFGSMATSSGFAFGPGFLREDLAGGTVRVSGAALVSTRLWQKYEAALSLPRAAGGRLAFDAEAARRDYRSLEFYGSGLDSSREARTNYRLVDTSLTGSATAQPSRFVRFGASLGGLWTRAGPGRRGDLVSTEARFNDGDAPGLAQSATFLRSGIFAQFDYRDNPDGPKSGGNYVSQYTWYRDQSLGLFGFRRWDVDVQQYVPFFNKTRRLALRARLTMTEPGAGQRVPFYLQPYVGGSDDLRGFRPYRFTGSNAVVYNVEYRWEVFSGLDGALFFDAGKVMPHRGWLKMADLETSAGFGFRFNAANRVFLRLDAGFSHEGVGVWLKFNDPFLPRLFGTATGQPLY
ncbi:MAG TPA: BamA/TamA family outer membrane protein [Bryobacteraceae bacterium]|nr:BamA/TamA family outer membrane protein [Bryobacteraceae bacterium]